MNRRHLKIVLLLLVAAASAGAQDPPLRLAQTIPLKGVEGRIDHLSIDAKNQRLFIAALGNGTVEVIDLRTGTPAGRIDKLTEPQGVCWLADLQRLVVASGGDGTVRFYDASLKPLATIERLPDADNVRYDSAAKRVYVGYGGGALNVLDAEKMATVAEIPLTGHPESFQLDPASKRAYVNVPSDRHVPVVDLQKALTIDAFALPADARNNFPMALDAAGHRLFIVCRTPGRFIALDTAGGKLLAEVGCSGDADDLFFDARLDRVYISGGEGAISIIDAKSYHPLGNLPTASGARTCLLDADTRRLYLAVPHRGAQRAEIRVYQAPQQ
jgi:DNA-binding beta-propeller fold protein YncE